ncbi:hypothetical protein BDW02DRAFT_502913, partial [Decorospora gaudefroyi]
AYHVRSSAYFQEGKLFAILFTELAGEDVLNAKQDADCDSAISRVPLGGFAYTQLRRFIVVKRRREYCYAVPVFTYNNRGTLRPGAVRDEHAIAYTHGQIPQLLQGEQQLSKSPISVVMNEGECHLSTASRIYFGIHHPIQYNVKVKDLGYVHPDWMSVFLDHWRAES